MKKRFCALLLAISLLLCAAPHLTQPAKAAQEPLRYGRKALQTMEDSEKLLYTYDTLVAGIDGYESKITLDKKMAITKNDLTLVRDAIRSDYPEFFWFSGAYSYGISSGIVLYVEPQYSATALERLRGMEVIAEKIKILLTGLEGKSDYEISKLIHDRLAAHITYKSSEDDQTIYGAILDGGAVCAGYAAAYQYLLQQVGIPAWTITGSSVDPNDPNSSVGHAWNVVCLDGNWYHTDLTWDDSGNLNDLHYYYLNVTTEQILEDHTIDDFFAQNLPECTATDANYLAREGVTMSEFDAAPIAEAIRENALKARVCVTGDMDTFCQAWMDNANTIINNLGLTGSLTYGYRAIGREAVLFVIDLAAPIPVGISWIYLPNNTAWEGTANVSGGYLTVHYNNGSTQPLAISDDMISGFDPYVSGKQVITVTTQECTEYFTIENTAIEPPVVSIPGDLNGDDTANNDDVVVLLWNTLFPEDYPLSVSGDLNGDGEVNNNDVIILLWHTLFPSDYPL